MILDGFEDAIIFFDDHFTQNSTLFESDEVIYQFEIDENDPLSVANDRFSIRVAHRLNVRSPELATVMLFPNPISGERFNIYIPANDQVAIAIRDILGRTIFEEEYDVTRDVVEVVLENPLRSGVYLVSASLGGKNVVMRLISQ